jgi:hypothetical protein
MIKDRRKFLLALVPGITLLAGITTFVMSLGASSPSWHGPHLIRSNTPQVTVLVVIPHLPSPAGMDHYVEHLAWLNATGKEERGTERHSNAWTNAYAAGYWLTGNPDDLPDLLRSLARVFDPIALDRSFAEEERGIILQEYRFRLGSDLAGQMTESMAAWLYIGNDIARSLIGTPEEIAAFDYEQALDLHKRSHQPARAALLIEGPVSARDLRRSLRESGFPALSSETTAIVTPAFQLASPDSFIVREPAFDGPSRLYWRKVVQLAEPVNFDLLDAQAALLAEILDSAAPGGMAGPLRHDAFIARSFTIDVFPIDERHVELSFMAEPDVEVSFEKLRKSVDQTFLSAAKGIPEATFERVWKRFHATWPDWSDADETSAWIAEYSLRRVSHLRAPAPKRDLQILHDQLALEEINALLAALAGPGRSVHGYLGKDSK